ncbi:phosphatidylethanolamine-binding protein [Mycena sanguinolenta]|nr:phosphatidylethanolamine-binding protein [Mycena sanguinolenta]
MTSTKTDEKWYPHPQLLLFLLLHRVGASTTDGYDGTHVLTELLLRRLATSALVSSAHRHVDRSKRLRARMVFAPAWHQPLGKCRTHLVTYRHAARRSIQHQYLVLTEARIIPEVLGSFTTSAFLSTILLSGPVSLGAEVSLETGIAIAAAPSEDDIGADGLVKNDSLRYTLAMFDPDAPSAAQPTSNYWTDADRQSHCASVAAHTRCQSVSPTGPPKGSGIHRYTFALFREPPNFSLPEGASELDPSIEARRRWDAVKFVERNGLQLVGAAFYLVRGED